MFNGTSQSIVNSIKLTDGKKTKKLFYNQGHYIEYILTTNIDTTISIFRHVQGSVTKITKDSLILLMTEDDLFQRNSDCSLIEINKSYRYPNDYLKIRLDQLTQINYESKTAINWKNIGISSIIIGSLTSLILAPLISINYKTGQVNSTRYITCASIGLAFIVVCIPIVATSHERKYYFDKKYAPEKCKIWKLK